MISRRREPTDDLPSFDVLPHDDESWVQVAIGRIEVRAGVPHGYPSSARDESRERDQTR